MISDILQKLGSCPEGVVYPRRLQNHGGVPNQTARDRGIPEQQDNHRLAGQADIWKRPGRETGRHAWRDIRSAPYRRLPDPGLLPDVPGVPGARTDPAGQLIEEPRGCGVYKWRDQVQCQGQYKRNDMSRSKSNKMLKSVSIEMSFCSEVSRPEFSSISVYIITY